MCVFKGGEGGKIKNGYARLRERGESLLAIKGLFSRSVLEFWVLGIGYWKKIGTVGVFD